LKAGNKSMRPHSTSRKSHSVFGIRKFSTKRI